MAYSSERMISADQLLASVRRRKFTAAATFLVVFGIVVAAWILLPREYGSEGRLFVQLGRANLGTSTTPETARAVSIQDTRETEIRSVAEMIRSERVLGQVVDAIGAEAVLKNVIPLPLPAIITGGERTDEGMSQAEYEKLRNREKAIRKLEGELDVVSEKKTSVISVYCTGATPAIAQQIVQEIMEAIQRVHVEFHSSHRSRNFFDREFEKQKNSLEQAEAALARFRDEHRFLSVLQARNTLNGLIDKLENQVVDVSVDLDQSLALVMELASQTRSVDEELDMPRSGLESLSTESAEQQLYSRIGEKARLLAKYNTTHPKVIEINKEIERLRQIVGELPTERVESDKVRNPVFEALQLALLNERSRAKSLERRLERVHEKRQEAAARLVELNHLETVAARFQREITVAKNEFDMYARKRGEARVVDQLDQAAISDVVIAQPASLILKKHSPRGRVMFPLGLVFATLCGLTTAIFADRKKLTGLSTPGEIETALDLPVLVSIPRVHSSRVLTP